MASNKYIIDLHCDTILDCYREGARLADIDGHINTEKLIKGGCLAQCFALFIPTHDRKTGKILTNSEAYELYKNLLRCYNENIDANSDVIRRAFSADDVVKNADSGFISSILTVEDGVEIDGKIERVDELYSDGVRMIALTWNYENSIGFPNSTDPEEHRKGLKEFGFEAVSRMNELGMIVDVSHLSEGGFYDVAKRSKKPFAASHSCSRELRDHQRNLTDDQLRTLADRGGVCGINFNPPFLTEDNDNMYFEDVAKHLLHMKKVGGAGVLALGSDFDGIGGNLEIKDYAGYPRLIGFLEKYFKGDELEMILNKNFLRVFRDQQ